MRARRTSRKPSHDRWLVSYADFTTLLFAFFTAVYAVTAQDASKLPRLADELTGQDGVLATTAGQPEPIDTTVMPDLPEPEPEVDVRARLEQERLQLIDDPRGLVVAIPEAGAFGDGAAELSPDARAIIGRLGNVLATLPNAVRVEGHTDNRPIRTDRYQSNWELSTSRATEVVAFLVGSRYVSADRLSVAGYAEHRPRGDNGTVAGRASNRRVDIVVLNDTTRTQEEPAPAGAPR
jgi:chemotaxis protein MotB